MVEKSPRPKARPQKIKESKPLAPEKSIRPKTREQVRVEDEMRQLGNLEFRADMEDQLSWNPLARLGFEPDQSVVGRPAYNSPRIYEGIRYPYDSEQEYIDETLPMAASGAEYRDIVGRVKPGSVIVNSNTAKNPVWSHEYTHGGLEKVMEYLAEDRDFFTEKYGEDTVRLLDEIRSDTDRSKGPNEKLTEMLDDVSKDLEVDLEGNLIPAAGTALGKMDNTRTAVENWVANPTSKSVRSRRTLQEYLKLGRVKDEKLHKSDIESAFPGYVGIFEAAEDMLEAQGEPLPTEKRGWIKRTLSKMGFDEGGLAQQTEEALGLATPTLEETQESKDARVKAATSRRPGFRGDGPFDFAGFGSYLKENVSEEELIAGLDNAGEWLVPFYDAGSNMVNVIDEYTKPEEERDYDYIQSELSKAGTSAATEGAMWLMGGLATKYGIKGVKALSNKAKQYEIDPNSMSAFGVGAIKKKAAEPLEIGFNEALQDGKFLKGYDASTASGMAEKAKNATAGNTRANALMNAAVPEGTRVGVRLNLNSSIPDMPKGLDKLQTLHKGSFSGTAMSYLPFATVRNVTFNVSQKGRTAIASRIKQIDTPEAKSKYPAMSVDGDYVPNKNLLDDGSDLVEIGLNPGVHHLFIDLKTGQAVKGAEEATVIGDRVYAKGVEYWKKAEAPAPLATQSGVDIPSDVRFKFKKGGAVMGKQMEMAFGGSVEEIDPVSGNEVPPGSTPKEVRDDIPAMLSEGEYVVPADVTRFYGVKFFEDLREQAKVELADMEANGRIGGEPVPEGEDDLTEDEMALLQEVMASDPETMGMFQGGMVNQQQMVQAQQPNPMNQQMPLDLPNPTGYTKAVGMAAGGMPKDPFGNPLQPTQTSPNEPAYSMLPVNPESAQGIYGITTASGTPYTAATPATTQAGTIGQAPVVTETTTTTDKPDATGGMKTVFYINKDCTRISVLMLNGNPISSVPADFNEYVEETPENSARLGCSITDEETTTETETTETATEGATVNSDDDNSLENYKVNVRDTVDPDTPEGARKLYEDSGVNTNDPLTGAKDALKDVFKVSKGVGAVLGAVNPYLAVIGGVANTVSQLEALSQANANKQMAEFLGKTEDAAAIQKAIDSFLEKAPGVVSALDSVFAKGTERFNNALETSVSQYATEGNVLNVEGLNETGKKNLKEYLGYEYKEVPLTGGGAVATDPSQPGSTASSYTAPKSDDGFNQGYFTPGATTVKPRPRPASVAKVTNTATTPSSISTATQTEAALSKARTDLASATKAVSETSSNDPNWGAKIKAQSDASKAFTKAKKASTGWGTEDYVATPDPEPTVFKSNDSSSSSSSSASSSSGCCFIMLEARYGDGTMDEVVRRYRDEYMTDRNRRGYYKTAEVLVPLMRKSKAFKWVVTKTFADPLVSYGKYYYGENKHGVVFAPVKNFWMKVFDVVGGDTEFVRENGEVV